MSVTSYSFTKAVQAVQLEDEIDASAIITALDSIVLNGVDDLTISFKAALSSGDEAILNAIVAAHNIVPIPDVPQLVTLSELKDTEGALLSRQRAFANADGFRFRGRGVRGIATKTTTTNLDFLISEERWINGVNLILKNQTVDDDIRFQIVDKTYVYAGVLYPATYTGGIAWSVAQPSGVILDEFGETWNMSEDSQDQGSIILPYPARILAGLYIRIKYTSVGTVNDVLVRANLYLHKKT